MFCRATPYEGKEPYIFISYCHADKELIYPLIEQISLDGYRVWYDVGNKPGFNWLMNIEEHLENSKAVIAFISKHSRDSNNCNKEIVYAMKCEKKIIPVLIDDATLPRGLRMQLVDLHYLERKNFPSDKELLKKCYEPQECQACKDPSGSIPLRNDEGANIQNTPRTNIVSDFISSLTPISRQPKKAVTSSTEPQKAPPANTADVITESIKPEPVKTVSENTEPVKSKTVNAEPAKSQPEKTGPVKVNTATVKSEPDDRTIILTADMISNTNDFNSPVSEAEEDDDMETTVLCHEDEEDDEGTVVLTHDFDDEQTVRHTYEPDLDGDQTVRLSRNFAILLQPSEQKAFTLRSPKISIGRSQIRCDVAIESNDSISRVHAYISQTRDKCYLEDNKSANGTFVNGQQLEPGEQVALDNPAVFQLNDETLILLSGNLARKYEKKKSVSLIINEQATEVKLIESDNLPLNRNSKWPGGTLADPKIHRAAHACLVRQADGIYLVDESPERGNGTYLNGSRMRNGESRQLSSGDRMRLGDTTLEFISIEIQP